jgi:hypothetical protein
MAVPVVLVKEFRRSAGGILFYPPGFFKGRTRRGGGVAPRGVGLTPSTVGEIL